MLIIVIVIIISISWCRSVTRRAPLNEIERSSWNIDRTEIMPLALRDSRPIIIYLILSVILSGKRAVEMSRENNAGGKGSDRVSGEPRERQREKGRDCGMIGRGRIGASERRHSREAVFEGRLAIDQMESLANQLGAPTAARKRLQADLLPRLSGYSAERQREIAWMRGLLET